MECNIKVYQIKLSVPYKVSFAILPYYILTKLLKKTIVNKIGQYCEPDNIVTLFKFSNSFLDKSYHCLCLLQANANHTFYFCRVCMPQVTLLGYSILYQPDGLASPKILLSNISVKGERFI